MRYAGAFAPSRRLTNTRFCLISQRYSLSPRRNPATEDRQSGCSIVVGALKMHNIHLSETRVNTIWNRLGPVMTELLVGETSMLEAYQWALVTMAHRPPALVLANGDLSPQKGGRSAYRGPRGVQRRLHGIRWRNEKWPTPLHAGSGNCTLFDCGEGEYAAALACPALRAGARHHEWACFASS